jgi:copper resistance protein C
MVSHRRRRFVSALTLGLASVALGRVRAVAAHAIVVASEPANGTRLERAPAAIRLRFNSRIEHRLSRLSLVGPDRRLVPLTVAGPAESPDRLVASLPSLSPGSYAIRWRVLAADGHITEGTIRFTVGPGS